MQTEYWYDATGLSREYEGPSGTGQTGGRGETLYTRSPGGGLLSIKTGGATRNYGMDRSGSVTALTGTDGSLDATYRYDPWGSSNGNTGTAYNPYRYTGTYFDSASDLYQMGARYYQAKSGRFTQIDPIDGWSYGYTPGNPVNYTDPTGLFFLFKERGGGGAISPNPGGGGGLGGVVRGIVNGVRSGVSKIFGGGGSSAPPIKQGSAGGSTAGQPFPSSVKADARAENPNAICVYCRTPGTATQVDHAIPRARGGDATIDNAQMTCPHCNASKGARDYPVTPPSDYQGPWPPPHWP